MTPEEFYAEGGEVAAPVLRKFIRFVRGDAVRQFSGVRIHESSQGKTLVVDRKPEVFLGSFRVALSGTQSVRVGVGEVNGIMPVIDGVRLDGLTPDGEPDRRGVPVIDVSEGPGEARRSYVGVRVVIDEDGEIVADDPESVTVVHRQVIPQGFRDEDDAGFWPLAMLQWDAEGSRVIRRRQWVHANLTHVFRAGEDARPGRHFFGPVG